MLEGALDFPSFQKTRKTFYNFRAAAVRRKFEEQIARAVANYKNEEPENAESKFTTEYMATVGAESVRTAKAWQQQAISELVEKFPLERETISLWQQMRNQDVTNSFKRNSHFTTPVEENIRRPPGEVCRLTRPMTAYEIYNRDFPNGKLPHWFHPVPSSDGVVQILRDLK